jgi:hypothetical protein
MNMRRPRVQQENLKIDKGKKPLFTGVCPQSSLLPRADSA